MNIVIHSISAAMLLIASLVAFVVIIRAVLPAFLLKLGCSLGKGVGRGYRKFSYPGGRAVAYEPHPSVRKYVNRYLLFVNDGYKYFKCRVDKGVKHLKYTVIMLNNKDKVIDTVEVEENIGDGIDGGNVLLHPDTSYVALSVNEANGISVKPQSVSYFSLARLAIYFAAVTLLSFAELLIATSCIEKFMRLVFSMLLPISGFAGRYFLWALLIAACSLSVLLLYCKRKGIRVVLNGN